MKPRRVVLGLLAGLIVGSVINLTGNPVALRVAGWLAPVGELWVNAIRMTVVPLVVSLVFVSIVRARGEGLGRLGGLTFGVFVLLLAYAAFIALLVVPPLMDDLRLDPAMAASLRASAGAQASAANAAVTQLPGFAAWFASLLPANPVRAAADGAMLPLIAFTLVIALAARRVEAAARDALTNVFAGLGDAMRVVVDWVIAAAPVGVFALVVTATTRAGIGLAGAMLYYVTAYAAVYILFTLLLYPVATMGGRWRLAAFIRAVLPAQAVALGSSSSLASLPALIEGGAALELPAPATGFVLPLAVSTFKIGTPISWLTGILFLARLYGVSLTGWSHVSIALTAMALSLSIPGVPQGALLLLTPVLVSYGIPAQGIALLLAADTIPDLVATAGNVTGDLVAAVLVGARIAPPAPPTVADEVIPAPSSADA